MEQDNERNTPSRRNKVSALHGTRFAHLAQEIKEPQKFDNSHLQTADEVAAVMKSIALEVIRETTENLPWVGPVQTDD